MWLAIALGRLTLGDRETFREIYRRTSARLFGVCSRILAERSDAEDALQDTYSVIWHRAALYDPARGTAMTWMIAIARNRALDCLRRYRRTHAAPIELADHVADPHPLASEILEANEELRQLSKSLLTIEPFDALLIRAAFFERSTYAELAQRTGMPLSTVKSRVRRALLRLRRCFSADSNGSEAPQPLDH